MTANNLADFLGLGGLLAIDWGVWFFSTACLVATLVCCTTARSTSTYIFKKFNMTAVMCFGLGVFTALLFNDFQGELIIMEYFFKQEFPNWKHYPISGILQMTSVLIMVCVEDFVHKGIHKHEEGFQPTGPSKGVLGMGFLLVALAVHSFLEGLPIGIKTKRFFTTAFSLFCHKSLEAIAIGVSLAGMEKKEFYVFITVYGPMTPLGCLLGAFVSTLEKSFGAQLTLLCLKALSTGLIQFLAFLEIFPYIRKSTDLSFVKKVIGIAVAYYGMTILSVSAEVAFEPHY